MHLTMAAKRKLKGRNKERKKITQVKINLFLNFSDDTN